MAMRKNMMTSCLERLRRKHVRAKLALPLKKTKRRKTSRKRRDIGKVSGRAKSHPNLSR